MRVDRRLAIAAAALCACACQSAPPAPPAASAPAPAGGTVALFQYAGSRQCERSGKTALDLERELLAAGVKAQAVSCAHDGRVYAQACGSGDGRLLVAQVPQAQAAAAARLGLRPLSELPEALAVRCR